jgi:TetR/AcrR family transcriptional regulator, ethionamide resistance regulator
MATRANRRTRSERRDEIRRQLLAAAEQLLESGHRYSELTIDQLVRQAGISRATFWAYFETKGDLLRALAEDVIGQLLHSAEPWWHLAQAPTEDAIAATIVRIAEMYHANRAVMAAVVEVSSYDESVKQALDGLVQGTIAGLTEHIADGQSRGFVDPQLDPRRTAAWLVWMSERGLYRLVGPSGPQKRRRYVGALAHSLWNALYATAPGQVRN